MAKQSLPNISGIKDKINIALYGGKSFMRGVRDTKYRAEVISCDCTHCTFRENGTCLKITAPFSSNRCVYGKKYVYEGYTPKAMICGRWTEVFYKDEKYSSLKSVTHDSRFGAMDGYYYINTSPVSVKMNDDGTYTFDVSIFSSFSSEQVFIKIEEVDTKFIKDLFSYTPCSFMGGEITDYRTKTVPLILDQMKKNAPELYERFTADYPEFSDVKPDFVGKTVYVNTLKAGIDIKAFGGTFHLSEDRKTLTCNDYRSAFLPFRAKTSKVIIEVTDDMTYKVLDNNETCEDTKVK